MAGPNPRNQVTKELVLPFGKFARRTRENGMIEVVCLCCFSKLHGVQTSQQLTEAETHHSCNEPTGPQSIWL